MGDIISVVLAAGKSTRMRSATPKVLHPVAGKSMLQHIVDVQVAAGLDKIYVVVGYQAEMVMERINGPITWVLQEQQLGTGHALLQAANSLGAYPGHLFVLTGDIPLLTALTLKDLLATHLSKGNAATVLSARVPDPYGYGRILRDPQGNVTVIEERDADSNQRQIDEISSGVFCFDWPVVAPFLGRLGTDNTQGEYYLTDILSFLIQEGNKTGAYLIPDYKEILGTNDRVQLAMAESIMRQRICNHLMLEGVTIISPENVWIDADVQVTADTVIYPNTIIRGSSKIGANCSIGPDVTIDSSTLGTRVRVRNAVIEEAQIGDDCMVGPYAYLRPGARIGPGVKIGDFVEVKNSQVEKGVKIPHHAYIGDASIGANTNIGCGVITANYDGSNKNKTEIGEGVFLGSNVNLIAPLKVGDGAFIAAGSTITESVPAKSMAIARARQVTKVDWRQKD